MIGKLFRAVLGVLVATFVVVTLAYADDAATENAAAEADPNDPSNHDPLEDINRAIFEINGVLYEVTTPFVELTPGPIRGMFKAIGATLNAPVHLVTTIITGDQANDDFADIARQNGIDCGFYLVLPLIGPTSSRGAVGELVEVAANPASHVIVLGAGAAANERIEAEVKIRELDQTVDAYAMARSATLQKQGCLVVDETEAPSAFGEEAYRSTAVDEEEN